MSIGFEPAHDPAAAVEIIDGAPNWTYGMLAANFARVQILVTWYGGDPDRYLDAVARGEEDEADVPFLVAMKYRMTSDPHLLDDISRILGEFASRLVS